MFHHGPPSSEMMNITHNSTDIYEKKEWPVYAVTFSWSYSLNGDLIVAVSTKCKLYQVYLQLSERENLCFMQVNFRDVNYFASAINED
jgi:hypothetical protein